ncbi:hypothetical protein OXYTRIMIC_756 [Oxytricha trifallax]|uniref:Uncharacterized protein n=1 Tax=Oxytricha trifallax TaxID=1172189 RepID=A0A073HY06_9SPIT|nr:hypothetical protein OXYTRIMIC_756 [Oxytricha trifallax]
MEEQKEKLQHQRFNQSQNSRGREHRNNNGRRKAQFLQKVKEIRYDHRDRSKDQEALGAREDRGQKAPLNKQLGFKSSRLKIGQSNPSKRINKTQPQRTTYFRHEDGLACVQADQMQLKNLTDMSEVTCQGFDEIIHAKKGWPPQVTRMVVIVLPEHQKQIERALVKRIQDREEARRKGMREQDLWSERQQNHWREINEKWQHEDMMHGRHIQEETMEVCLRQTEESQFCDQKISRMILHQIVMNDKGVTQIEKLIGATNWQIQNSRFLRESQDVKSVIIPVSFQSILKNCRNWVVLKIDKDSGQVEVYETRKEVGSLAIIQKHLDQINQMMIEIMGKSLVQT